MSTANTRSDPDDASEFTAEDFENGVWTIGSRVLTPEEARAEARKLLHLHRKAEATK